MLNRRGTLRCRRYTPLRQLYLAKARPRGERPFHTVACGGATLVRALGPVGMARFLQQSDPGHGDYTADRDLILGNPAVDDLMDELEHRRQRSRSREDY